MYKPTWINLFKSKNPDPRKMDSEKERLAIDVMIDEKERSMKTSKKAQEWESDRKREWREYGKLKKLKEKTYQQKVDEGKKRIAEAIKARRKKLKK